MKREDIRRRPRARARLLLLVACIVLIGYAVAASLPIVYAGSGTDEDIQFSTPGGGPGTHITATFQYLPPAPTTYQLYILSTDPAQGGAGTDGCASGTTWNGAPIFALMPSSGVRNDVAVSFTWPVVSQPGLYWLCAKPLRGPGNTLFASLPYIVPVSAPAASLVRLDATRVDAGRSLAVLVGGWKASDGDMPKLYLLPQGQPASASALVAISSWETVVNFDANKTTFGIVLDLEPTLTGGAYAIVARGNCRASCAFNEQSAFFTVRASAAPPTVVPTAVSTALPVATPSTKTLQAQSGNVSAAPGLLVGLGGGACLLAGSMWLVAWRRKRFWHPSSHSD